MWFIDQHLGGQHRCFKGRGREKPWVNARYHCHRFSALSSYLKALPQWVRLDQSAPCHSKSRSPGCRSLVGPFLNLQSPANLDPGRQSQVTDTISPGPSPHGTRSSLRFPSQYHQHVTTKSFQTGKEAWSSLLISLKVFRYGTMAPDHPWSPPKSALLSLYCGPGDGRVSLELTQEASCKVWRSRPLQAISSKPKISLEHGRVKKPLFVGTGNNLVNQKLKAENHKKVMHNTQNSLL